MMNSTGIENLYIEFAPVPMIVIDIDELEKYLQSLNPPLTSIENPAELLQKVKAGLGKISLSIINKKCRELFDITDFSPDYLTLNSLIDLDEFLSSEANLFRLFRDDTGENMVLSVTTFKGVKKTISLSWQTIIGDGGERKSILSLNDITRAKELEDELLVKERRLEYTEAVAHLGYYEIYIDTGTASWSDETFRIFDMDPEKDTEPTVENYLALIHPDDLSTFNQSFTVTLSEKKNFNLVYRIITSSGNMKYLHSICFPQFDEDGNIKLLTGTIQDVTHMKLTEDSLIEFQNRFSLFNEVLFDWIVMFRVEDNFRLVREWGVGKFDEVTGYTADEREKMGGIFGILHPDDRLAAMNNSRELLTGISPSTSLDQRIISKDGKIVWTRNYAKVIKDSSGKITNLIGAGKDITDIKMSEQKMRESEEKLKRAEEIAGFGHWYFDFTKNVVSLSSGAKKIYGIDSPQSDFSMESTLEFLDEETQVHAATIYQTLAEGELVEPFEIAINLPDNNRKHIYIIPADIKKTEEGTTAGLFGAMFDLTKIKSTEEKLKISEENFRKVFEAAPFTLAITDIETGRILNANKFAEDYYGVKDFSGITTKVFFKNPADRDQLIETLKRDGKINNYEIEIVKPDGQERWVAINGRIIDYMGEKCLLNAQFDVTNQKKALELMQNAKQQAEEANRVKTNFLANMSHELRTPLIGIIGFAEILQEELKDENLRRMVSRIAKGANRLHSTVNLILDLTKLEKSDIKPVIARTDLFSVIENVISENRNLAQEKNLYLKIQKNCERAVSDVDGKLMGDVLIHLVNNALKYTFQGGATITISPYEDQDGNWNSISVKDTGIGLKKEETRKIFDDFIQVSEGYSRRFEGTGLGLTLVKRYTELMDGRLSVFSSPGEGSEFIVRFRTAGKKSDTGLGLQPVPVPAVKKRILYVEDDEVAIDLVTRFLSSHFEVDTAVTSELAIRMAEENNYTGFLIDINLGRGMDGYGVTKIIRSIPEYRSVPIVAVTAYAMSGDEEDALKAGCSGYISKPFTKRDFTEYVFTAFGIQKKTVLPENTPD